jgi:signal peptidase
MIMITAIVTMMVTAIVSTVARYVTWQISVVGDPFYRFIIWHILLFSIALAIFLDRRQGFKKTIGIAGYIAQKYNKSSREGKINATMNAYHEHAHKPKLQKVLLPIAITLFVAYILSSHLLFFAIVTSGSMEPTFKKGDLVFMQDFLIQPKVGDIIIFPDPTSDIVSNKPITVTHRIVEINGDIIRTKGDNNPNMDNWKINKKNVIGKAIIIGSNPVVLKNVGRYFLLDFRTDQYSEEYLAIAKTIQNLRTMGLLIFFVCLAMYLFMSIRDSRPSRRFKSRRQ